MTSIKNLIAVDGTDRIIWNRDLGHLEVGEGDSKQTLLLTSRPYFSVREIKLSPVRDLLALIGDNGVTIVEMPRKWGRRFKKDTDTQLYCQTFNINERLFSCEKRIHLLHVMWHPHGSEYKQTLCILTNENRLRFNEITKSGSDEVQVINLRLHDEYADPQEEDSCLGMSMLNLGDVSICFDFGPPMLIKEKEVLWPIYVLMGTGDVLLIYTNLHNPSYAENIIGPLTILPQAEDNYGSDACHLIVLDSSPPLLAIATPSGRIYHCFAFPDNQSLLAKQTLYMYESIELSKDLIENPDDPYTPHPMKLFKDPTSEIRYFCVHHNGVHTVVLPILEHVQSDCDIIQERESFSEFLVCTRTTTPSDANESVDDLSTPRGLGIEIRKSNMALIVLMSDNEIIMHRISPATTLINRKRFPRHSMDSRNQSNDQEILNISQIDASRANFADQIQQILKRKTCVPMLKLSENLEQNNNVSELIDRAVTTFNNEYLKKFNLANDAIKKKLTILEKDKENQLAELEKISKEKEEVYSSVVGLSTKADKACQKQKELLKRIDRVVAAVSHGHPDLSEVESKLRAELTSLREKIRLYRDQLESAINKHNYHLNQKDYLLSSNNGDLVLSSTQLNGIRETLAKQGADISELKRVVKSRQKQ